MKRCIVALLCIVLLFGLLSCSPEETGEETQSSTLNHAAALAAAEQKAAYYQERAAALEGEIISLKATLQEERTAYEARISALEAALKSEDAPTLSPTDFPFTYTLENGGITVTGFRGGVRDLTIPATLDGYPVVAIADRAFENAHELRTVTISSGVTSVGWFAFGGCTSLERVEIPASVTVIKYGAFQNCPAALTVYAPLGSYADAWARSYGIGVENGE